MNESATACPDWNDPGFFADRPAEKKRFHRLFMRQLMPRRKRLTRLTTTGWFLIAVALGIGMAAYNTASNILFMTLALLLSSLVLSGVLSVANFRKLRWSVEPPERMRAGEVAVVSVAVANGKKLFPSLALWFTLRAEPDGSEERIHLRDGLSAGERTELEWTLRPLRRGPMQLGLVAVESRFPFGFLRKGIEGRQRRDTLVWPSVASYRFQPRAGGRLHPSGAVRRRVGQGADLLNIRPYQRGDPPRLVHWKASARLQKLMVRQLAEESESGFVVEFACDEPAWRTPERFERLCALACSVAGDLHQRGRLDGYRLGRDAVHRVRTMRELHGFFDALAQASPGDYAASQGGANGRQAVRFRPEGTTGIAIYVDDHRAGEADA